MEDSDGEPLERKEVELDFGRNLFFLFLFLSLFYDAAEFLEKSFGLQTGTEGDRRGQVRYLVHRDEVVHREEWITTRECTAMR